MESHIIERNCNREHLPATIQTFAMAKAVLLLVCNRVMANQLFVKEKFYNLLFFPPTQKKKIK